MEVVDEVFVGVEGFFSDILLREEVGMGRGSGCVSLYDFVCSVVVRGSVKNVEVMIYLHFYTFP